MIVREARRLIHLVENVLHFSRAERRIVHVTPRGQPLEPLLRDIVAAFVPLVQSKGTRIAVDVTPALVARVDADALRHVLLNLLDNASRYGPAVQTIVVGAARAGEWVTIWVDDEGPGIPADDRKRIWRRFTVLRAVAWRARRGPPRRAHRRRHEADQSREGDGGRRWVECW